MFYEEACNLAESSMDSSPPTKVYTEGPPEDLKSNFFAHYCNFKNFFKRV